jgi:hypothetical protein
LVFFRCPLNSNYTTARMDYAISARPSRTPIVIRGKSRWTQKSDRGNWFVVSSNKPRWQVQNHSNTRSSCAITLKIKPTTMSWSRCCFKKKSRKLCITNKYKYKIHNKILLKINMYPESLLINKLKLFLIQFIKKYQTQYRYLGKYLLGQI